MKPKTSTNNAINQDGSVFGGNNETELNQQILFWISLQSQVLCSNS